MPCYSTASSQKLRKFFGRIKVVFWRNQSTTSQILRICQILGGVHAKNLKATSLFVNFSKVFDSIHRGKMEQILLAYALPKETVTAIMMFYKNTEVKVCSSDEDTDFFDIVASVLQCHKEIGFPQKRQKSDNTSYKLLRTQTTQMT